MDVLALLREFGIPAGIAIAVVVVLLPVVKDKVIPAMLDIIKSRDDFQKNIELRRVASAERTDENMSKLAQAVEIVLQNQTSIRAREDDILETLHSAIQQMTNAVAERKGYDRGRKEHKPGDTGPLDDTKG